MGAVVVTAAILAAPTVALAGEDDPAQLQFKLPNAEAVHDFETLGLNMDHGMQRQADGSAIISAWATDEQAQMAELHGYEVVGTITSKYAIDAIRAERDTTLAGLKARQDRAARRSPRGLDASKSVLPGTVRVQRAEFWENNVERYISIEATTTKVHLQRRRQLQRAGPRRRHLRRQPATASPAATCRPSPTTSSTTRTSTTARGSSSALKSAGGPDPAYVVVIKVASPNGDVRHARRQAVDRQGSAEDDRAPEGLPHALQRLARGVQEDARPRGRVPERSPRPSSCRSRRAATSARPRRCSATRTRRAPGRPRRCRTSASTPTTCRSPAPSPTTAQQASTVVLTSKDYGHQGGNNLDGADRRSGRRRGQPGAQRQPHRQRDPHQPGDGRQRRDHEHRGAGRRGAQRQPGDLQRGHGVAVSGRTPAPASCSPARPRRSTTCCAPRRRSRAARRTSTCSRIGKVRDGSKVGVFLYCQEHGNEIATSGVCLETAERLVRNYGTDARDDDARRQPRHLHRPADQRRRRDALAV